MIAPTIRVIWWPRGRPRSHSLRAVLDAIFYLLRTGCPWRYLPRDFPPWQTVYHHFRRFRLSGMWHLILTSLRTAERRRMGRDTQPTAAIIDAQSMKTVEESFGPNLLYIVRRPLCIGGFTLRGISYVWSRGRAVDRLTKETDNTHRTYSSPS